MLIVLSACVLTVLAAGLIFHSWRRSGAHWAALAGWLSAFASPFVWAQALGAEVGVIYAISAFICLVWLVVVFTAPARVASGGAVARPYQPLRWATPSVSTKQLMVFLLSVPTMGVITMMLSVGLVQHTAWNATVKFAVAMVLYPVLWGALSTWVAAQTALLKPTVVSVVLFVLAALLMFV